jgi:hypothetical protein
MTCYVQFESIVLTKKRGYIFRKIYTFRTDCVCSIPRITRKIECEGQSVRKNVQYKYRNCLLTDRGWLRTDTHSYSPAASVCGVSNS